jgi:hypothetical protein
MKQAIPRRHQNGAVLPVGLPGARSMQKWPGARKEEMQGIECILNFDDIF